MVNTLYNSFDYMFTFLILFVENSGQGRRTRAMQKKITEMMPQRRRYRDTEVVEDGWGLGRGVGGEGTAKI